MHLRSTWIAALSWLACWQVSLATEPERLSFNAHIRPILSDKCFACHGFDAQKRQADLRLDLAEAVYAQRDPVAAITPGQPAQSLLWQRIVTDDDDQIMPPRSSHKRLSNEEKALIGRWITEGAVYQKHWAFEPIQTVSIPPSDIPLSSNPVDAFIAVRLAEQGRQLAPEAEKSTLVRRVALALTGLPPNLEEVEQYLGDSANDAYERMVERYLDSRHFGEEMARHWLDVARYADTHGMHLDNERQTWAYRDWVIGAFNRNLPFDQFTIEQLAGDLLPDPTQDQLIATGFNRCNVTTSEGGSINEELLYRYAVDRASTTMQTWLGLTGGCAVCHDHKFDPITQKEFYAFYAFFNSAADPAMDGNALLTQPILKLTTDEDKSQLDQLEQQLQQNQQTIDHLLSSLTYSDPASLPDQEPAEVLSEDVWMEDDVPPGGKLHASPGKPTQFVTQAPNTPVYSGQRAIKRSDPGLAQDVWDQATTPLQLPSQAKIFAYVYLDPDDPPRAIMLQFFKDDWKHRGVWGDYEAIAWGTAGTTERVAMGPLPALGQWQRLEIPVAQIGLAPGDALKGFALTQFGGTVYWDHVGVSGSSNPATDPLLSFTAWWKSQQGKDNSALPADLKALAKAGPAEGATGEEVASQAATDGAVTRLRHYYWQHVCKTTRTEFEPLLEERKRLSDQRRQREEAIPGTFVFKDLAKPRESYVMMRGAYDKPGERVEPNVLQVLPPLEKSDPTSVATRLDLARWLVADNNPLTARVTVNRFWQQFFGNGLVQSSYDFGSQGELPSHPELLDWLARDFQASQWNVKRLVRMLVCSKTFRQDSQVDPELLAADPENRWLARGPRFRLDAEQIRDNALAVSGLINLQMGGKGVKPYQPDNIWEPVGFGGSNTRHYKRDDGPALYRRSIYNFFKRTAPPPFMVNFDAPNREQFCTKREKSNTPLQALQLMNDVQHIEAARFLAERMLKSGLAPSDTSGPTDISSPSVLVGDDKQLAVGFRIVLARWPTERELSILLRQLQLHRQRYQADPALAAQLIKQGERAADPSLAPVELAAFTVVANTLLNLDETLTRN